MKDGARVVGIFALILFGVFKRLTPRDIILDPDSFYQHHLSCGNDILEATKQTNLNDIALFSLQPRCDNNNNGGRIKIFRSSQNQQMTGTVEHALYQNSLIHFLICQKRRNQTHPRQISPSISDVNDNTGIETDESEYNFFKDLVKLRRDAPTNIICAYLNINSYRYKFESIIDLLNRNIVDILFLSETKLDDSFPDAMFTVDNFSFYRSDRNKYGGGVLAYMRSDLAGDRNKQAEFQDIESIALEVTTEDNKWLFIGAFQQPSIPDSTFSTDFNLTTDKVIKKYDNVLIMGDLNFNMLDDNKSSTLNDSCDIFCMKNIINKATCYNRNSKPTLLDQGFVEFYNQGQNHNDSPWDVKGLVKYGAIGVIGAMALSAFLQRT
ncbi:unnamed protein product [Mytilus edulis]|uniref:Endonuclease/exonuclease/phosphatase domain-containing protein n=1 Tax=Mytilus edulis TaxID=6550 RepID=A0A8S3PQN6_MYTED|nr:unnamed protein product [Mytilus edulis]